jgi:hypothetical protein
MTAQFTAIVEQGRLRPKVPLELPEGAEVEVLVMGPDIRTVGGSPAAILAAIAALPSEAVDPTTSVNHDEVLYGREAHP